MSRKKILRTKRYELNKDTNQFDLIEETIEPYSDNEWETYIVGSRKYFNSTGDSKYDESISPCRQSKTIRTLEFCTK